MRASSPKALQTLSLCCWGAVCFATDLKTDGTSPPSGGAVAWSNRRSLLPGGRPVRDRKRNPRSPPLLAGEEIGAESPTPAQPGIRPRLSPFRRLLRGRFPQIRSPRLPTTSRSTQRPTQENYSGSQKPFSMRGLWGFASDFLSSCVKTPWVRRQSSFGASSGVGRQTSFRKSGPLSAEAKGVARRSPWGERSGEKPGDSVKLPSMP